MARLTVAAVTLCAAVTFAPAPAAHASTNSFVVTGTGTINPGLPCPPSGCDIHMDFTTVWAGPDLVGTSACTFDGTDTFPGGATLVAGSGAGTILCAGDVSASGTVSFYRTGGVLSVSGIVTVDDALAAVSAYIGWWLPTTTPPVTSYSAHGGGTSSDDRGPRYFYPSGTVTITVILGQTSFDYSDFNPPLGQGWTCTEDTTSTTCVPPLPPKGYRNRCGQVGVTARNDSAGTVTGRSGCVTEPSASASAGAGASASDGRRADTEFPWQCDGTSNLSVAWQVTCTLGP